MLWFCLVFGWESAQVWSQTVPPAPKVLALPVRLLDISNQAYEGAFDVNGVRGCTLEIRRWTTGLVADTLSQDSLTGRKRLHAGPVQSCTNGIEDWFKPEKAVQSVCGEIRFDSTSQSGLEWNFFDSTFFPVDSISQELGIVDKNGNTVANDFSFCMESHAQLLYQGGESFELRGDDDLWIYIDNRLAADMGGIHFPIYKRLSLDSLPFLQNKRGQDLDVDLYYCSRQPPTSVLGIRAPLSLKARTLQQLTLVDSNALPMSRNPTVVGKTRLCSWPTYDIPRTDDCGQKLPPVAFYPSHWKLNGIGLDAFTGIVSDSGSAACIDLDPKLFPDHARITVTAAAEGRQARMSLTLVRAAKVQSGVLRGEGRIQTVELRLDTTGGTAASGLKVDFSFGGVPYQAWTMPRTGASQWSLGADSLQGSLNLNQGSPLGVTGFPPVSATATQFILGQTLQQTVTLLDRVSPILTQAQLRGASAQSGSGALGYPAIASEPGSQTPYGGECGTFGSALDLDLSESIYPKELALGVFLAKLQTGERVDLADHAAQCLVTDSQKRRLLLPDAFAKRLQAGDSLTLGPMAKDSLGNAAGLRMVAIDIPSHTEVTVGKTRVLENPALGKAFAPTLAKPVLVPVSSGFEPLLESDLNRSVALARGPVFVWTTPAPLSVLRLQLYDNLGRFVAAMTHHFTDAEWRAIAGDRPNALTELRLMLYPVADNGQRLATGVYIAKVEGEIKDGSLISVAGVWQRVEGRAFSLPPIRFGYIREN